MHNMLCRNRVVDFEKWKRTLRSHAEAHRAIGLRLVNLWRCVDDPNNVFFLFEVSSIEMAHEFVNSSGAAEAGKESGVIDGEWHIVEDCDAFS